MDTTCPNRYLFINHGNSTRAQAIGLAASSWSMVNSRVKSLLAKFADYDDRENARSLIGLEIRVARAQLPALADDEYYWADLIGMHVSNTDGINFGQVTTVVDTGANDVLVELKANGNAWCLSYSRDYVRNVDLSARQILVDWDADF